MHTQATNEVARLSQKAHEASQIVSRYRGEAFALKEAADAAERRVASHASNATQSVAELRGELARK